MKNFCYSLVICACSSICTAQTGTSTEVGITEGQLSVSLTGSASYSIPIAIPPGINGVVPQVGLVYNSQAGNGLAGYGWNISGVSSITRIPATKFHDGTIDPVDFDSLDRFAFDGQRLMIKSGTSGTYGANATVYETENFSNVKITSYGVHPNGANYGPAYFIVQYPDGSKAYYGNSTDSRTITNWSITYWENPQGVRISYAYNNSNNNLNIATIKYGTLGAIAPINTIQFNYVAAKHPEQTYVGGLNITNNTILNTIAVTGNSVGFRSYWMAYGDTSLGYQRLLSITEKSGDGSKSYNPTVFTYDTTAETITGSIKGPVSVSNISASTAGTVTGDFNGDGSMDFLIYPTTGTEAKKKFWIFPSLTSFGNVEFGQESQSGAFDEIFPVTYVNYMNKLMPLQGWTMVQGNTFTTLALAAYGPVQQDQKKYTFPRFILDYTYECSLVSPMQKTLADNQIIKPVPKGPTPVHYEREIPRTFYSGDFNGDGLTDIVAIEKSFTYPRKSECLTYSSTYYGGRTFFINLDKRITSNFANGAGYLSTTNSSIVKVGDFNGDGKADIYVFDTGKVKIYGLDDNKIFVLLYQTTTADANIVLDRPILMGDYNGDGKTDFIIPKGAGYTEWYKYSATGTNLYKETQNYNSFYYQQNTAIYTYHYIPTDYNNDGKTDLLFASASRGSGYSVGSLDVTCYVNKNGTFSGIAGNYYSGRIGDHADIYPNALPVFLNSDQPNRKLELCFFNNDKVFKFNSAKDFSKEQLLKTIKTGNGVKESITYQPLSSSSREDNLPIYYDSRYTENYPNFDITEIPSLQVVTKLEKTSATTYKKQLFSYYGAVSNVEGRGFLGFRSTGRTNWFDASPSAITTISIYDINLRGANTENYSVLGTLMASSSTAPSTFITKSVLTYASSLGSNKVFAIKNTSSKQFNGLDNTSSETTNTFDAYNNPTQSTTLVKQAGVIQQTTVSNLTYDNFPTGTPYVIGRPNNKKQTVTVTGDTMKSEEQYTYANCLLTDIKKFAGTDYITEHNDYDAYGNITQKIITYPGLTARKTSHSYDTTGRFLTKSTDIEGLSTTFVYNTDGTVKSETNPYNLTTTYAYDAWLKKIKTTDYLGKNATYLYTRNGVNTTITTTGDDGSVSEEIFDDLGRKTKSATKDLTGTFSYVSYLYDNYDRKVKVSEPYSASASQWNESQYDVYGRVSKSISFTGKTVNMTYTGLRTKVDDGTTVKESTKNAIGKVVSMTDTPGGTINYTYFANGNLKTSEYGGVNTIIEQDVWGRKTKLTDPSAGIYNYSYNGFGETVTEKTPNGTTTYTLDPAVGKITGKKITNNAGGAVSTTTYTYDSTTKLPTSTLFSDAVEGNQIRTTYVYDAYKRLSSSTEVTPYATFTKKFTYDAFGRVLNETSNATANGKSSNKTIMHTYKNGQPWQLVDTSNNQVLWQTNTVNARGQLTTATLGNGITITNTYDSNGFINIMQHNLGTANVMKHETAFDAKRSNLLTRNNSLFRQKETFEYDSQDRLTSINSEDVLVNNTFSSSTEGYQTEGGATISSSGGQLTTQVTASGGSIKKTLLTGSTIGDIITVNFKFQRIQGGDVFNIYIQEENPATGAIVKYLKKAAVTGANTFTHVPQYSTVVLRIEKVNTTALNIVYFDDITATRSTKKTQEYDNRGRIAKNNIGEYEYKDPDSQKAYRNTAVTVKSDVLAYYTTRHDQIISYTVFKSPIQIEESGIDKISFTYNDTNDRSAMFYGGLQNDKKLRQYRKYYSADGSMEIKHNISTGAIEFVTYIGGDGYSAPLAVKSDGTTQNYLYLHRDYQGSILAITNQAGAVVEKRLFDAWGSISKVQDGAGKTLAGLTILDRGYTGHEHLQSVGLINMNGRIYDPKLHRFLQPDNYVQDPFDTQNYNRYGYCWNNPLKYTDPSGEEGTYPKEGDPSWNDGSIKFGFRIDAAGWKRLKADFSRFWDNASHAWNTSNTKNFLDKISLNNISKGFKSLFGGGGSSSSEPAPIKATNINMNTNSTPVRSMFYNINASNNTMVSQYVEHAIIPANTIGDYDPTGGVLTGIGTGLAVSEFKMYNKSSWFSVKQWKTYSQSFNGNGYTGGKIASALKISTVFKIGGYGLGVYNARSINNQYNNGELNTSGMIMEQSSNLYATIGGLNGAAWGIGWEGGRAVTKTNWYQDWKNNYWYPIRYELFGY